MVANRSRWYLWTNFVTLGRPCPGNPRLFDTLLGRGQRASLRGNALALTGICLKDMPMFYPCWVWCDWGIIPAGPSPRPVAAWLIWAVGLFAKIPNPTPRVDPPTPLDFSVSGRSKRPTTTLKAHPNPCSISKFKVFQVQIKQIKNRSQDRKSQTKF